ncbi:hypothetical protein Tco_0245810 [Tanacetum coccineum]
MTPENKAHYELTKRCDSFDITWIGDEIYSHRVRGMSELKKVEASRAQKDKDMAVDFGSHCKVLQVLLQNLPKQPQNFLKTPENKNVDIIQDTDLTIRLVSLESEGSKCCWGGLGNCRCQVVQHLGYSALTAREFVIMLWNAGKPKRVRDLHVSQEKMLLCNKLSTDAEPLEQVHYDTDHNVFANDLQHFEQSESISNTCAVETGDSNVIPDSPDMCDNDIQNDQHDVECDDECADCF